ncbi:LCP family protein [Streptococcus hongkongensis]
MTRNGNGGLSHHEELRYYYLLRNLNYLSENENREFRYLKSKLDAGTPTFETQFRHGRHDYPEYSVEPGIPSYPNNREQNQVWSDESYQTETLSNGLPRYPKEKSLSRSARRNNFDPQFDANYQDMPPVDYQEPLSNYYFQENGQSDYQNEVISSSPAARSPKSNKQKSRKKRNFKFYLKLLLAFFLLICCGVIFMFFKGMFDISSNKKNYKPAVSEVFNGKDTKDGTNILVLGSDQRVTQGSTDARTDTIMVVNVGNKDKKVKMVSFMRDTLVNIPGYSYNDYSYDMKLNASFNLGEQDHHKGADLVRKTLKANYDIDCKYYVMVDFETFAEAIDTLFPNGVKIDAKFATIAGKAVSSVEVPDDLKMKDGVVPNQTIKVGEQRMDGRTLLNYARFRKDDDGDYGRTVRQQQVMTAIMSQVKNPTSLFTGSAAIGKIYALTSTNVAFPFLAQKGLSVISNGKGVDHVTIPENGDWIDEYDMYGGQALQVDFVKYQKQLRRMGLR